MTIPSNPTPAVRPPVSTMIEIRFHGRGGQGAVVASELLAQAAFLDGKEPQSFPFFGVSGAERR
ncbi:pyruvate/ketoisovalerate oxidoreductase, gamma subunit [mine drainage metagenome]|uniref:Pyruvate/ketoisovalerate oxidoreductase, gamma subunit n=1 Tax=mine drainage metagenome TaxID=410659 RepID=T0XYF1_9ZZZZ